MRKAKMKNGQKGKIKGNKAKFSLRGAKLEEKKVRERRMNYR
jgi:hypothetical protein